MHHAGGREHHGQRIHEGTLPVLVLEVEDRTHSAALLGNPKRTCCSTPDRRGSVATGGLRRIWRTRQLPLLTQQTCPRTVLFWRPPLLGDAVRRGTAAK